MYLYTSLYRENEQTDELLELAPVLANGIAIRDAEHKGPASSSGGFTCRMNGFRRASETE